MTRTLFSKAFAAAVLTATMVVSVLPASAATVRPAPPRDPNAVVTERNCYSENQVAANMQINLRNTGYHDTYRYRYYNNNGRKAQAFGVKDRDQWYAFVVELCRGTIIEEGKLKAKPGFL